MSDDNKNNKEEMREQEILVGVIFMIIAVILTLTVGF